MPKKMLSYTERYTHPNPKSASLAKVREQSAWRSAKLGIGTSLLEEAIEHPGCTVVKVEPWTEDMGAFVRIGYFVTIIYTERE